MSSFLGSATSAASYIQQNQTFGPGPLSLYVSAMQGGVDPVQIDGNYKFNGQLEINQLVSGTNELYLPNMVSQNHLNISGGLSRSPTTTINSATGVTVTMAQFKTGCIVRQGLLAGSAVTDTLPSGANFIAELITAGTTRMECVFILEFRTQIGAEVTFNFPADCTVDAGYRRVFGSGGTHQMVRVVYELITTNLATPPNARVRLISQNVLVSGAQPYLDLVDVAPYILMRETTANKELMISMDPALSKNYMQCDAAHDFEIYHGLTKTFDFKTTGQFKSSGGFDITGNGVLSGTLQCAGTTVGGTTLQRGPTFTKFAVSSALTTDGNLTFSAADVVNGFIRRDLISSTASRTDTFPSAASLVSTYGLAVGDSFQTLMEVQTASSGGWTYNCQPGTGGTIVGFTSLATNAKFFVQWRIIMTNVSSGTEAYYMIRHAIYVNGFTTFV